MKKKIVIITACIVIACIIGSLFLIFPNYVMLNGRIYDCTADHIVLSGNKLPDMKQLHRFEQLKNMDLGDVPCSVSEYDALCAEFPDCEIRWQVPFQGEYFDSSITVLPALTFDESDFDLLRYFPELETVDAQGCTDYDVLLKLQETYPDLNVMYEIELMDGQCLQANATECTVTSENVQQLREMIPYLPELRTIYSDNCNDYDVLTAIYRENPDINVEYSVDIGQNSYPGDATDLTLDISDAAEALELLQYFPDLQKVKFHGLSRNPDLMYQIMCAYPNAVIEWEFELYGVKTSSVATELILNQIPMNSVESVECALKYFYDLQWVEMCRCGISSEEMDALWKRHPETRFVWEIPMGLDFVRTDVKAFIPFKYGYDINRPFHDEEVKELKYLVDMECLDLGHMRMTDISFLQYMPKLRFLILADTVCEDFSYLANLTELVYLELFRSEIKDVNLLMNLTKLEDLNIGWTELDNPEKLMEMTWLKRLWATKNGMDPSKYYLLEQALPDTYVYMKSSHPTEGGWRKSDRYYEMRDLLGMFYMND